MELNIIVLVLRKSMNTTFTTNIMILIVSSEEKVIGLFESDRHQLTIDPIKNCDSGRMGCWSLNPQHQTQSCLVFYVKYFWWKLFDVSSAC